MNRPFQILVILWTIFSVPSLQAAERKKGMKMDAQKIELPFGLKAQDLARVEFSCEYKPLPSKPWTEAIRISGTTGITLLRSAPGSPKPDSLQAKPDPAALIALLKLFEEKGFLEKDAEVDSAGKEPVRYLSLGIPGQSNKVAISGRHADLLQQLLGAMKLVAGFGAPEALGNKFLKSL